MCIKYDPILNLLLFEDMVTEFSSVGACSLSLSTCYPAKSRYQLSLKVPRLDHMPFLDLLHLTDAPSLSQQMSHGVPMASFHQSVLCEAGRKGNGRELGIFPPFLDFYLWLTCPDLLQPSLATGRLARWQGALLTSAWMQGKERRTGVEVSGWSLSSICHTQQNILFKVL